MAEFKRSRLERKAEEQFTKKTIFMGFLTIILFVLVLVFGLPLLIKFSVFLGNNKSKVDNTSENVLPPLAPRIEVPFEATNSSKIDVSGFTEANIKVELFKNDQSLGEVDVGSSGDFIYSQVGLDEGDNVFTAVAKDSRGKQSEISKSVNVAYDTTVPQVAMLTPGEDNLNVTVDKPDYDITGQSEKGVSVMINDRVAMVDDTGKFKLKFQLNAGKNDIVVDVKDLAGNETKKNFTITYDF